MCSGLDLLERDPRSSRMLRCEVVDSLGRSHSCVVRNISRHGLGGSGARELANDGRVTIIIPELATLTGTVRWVAGGKFGVQLDQAIEPELVRFVGERNEAAPKWEVCPRYEPAAEWRGPRA